MKILMRSLLAMITVSLSANLWAAGHDHDHDHSHAHHGAVVNLGVKKSDSWKVTAKQFGHMTADSKELVFTIILSAKSGADLDAIEAVRLWLGDSDSESLVNKFKARQLGDNKLSVHGHVALAQGDDRSQFTIEVDAGGEGEVLTFKTL